MKYAAPIRSGWEWLLGFAAIAAVGAVTFQRLSQWIVVAQVVYVVPVVAVADRRGKAALGVGVLCGAAAVLGVGALASLVAFVFVDF